MLRNKIYFVKCVPFFVHTSLMVILYGVRVCACVWVGGGVLSFTGAGDAV